MLRALAQRRLQLSGDVVELSRQINHARDLCFAWFAVRYDSDILFLAISLCSWNTRECVAALSVDVHRGFSAFRITCFWAVHCFDVMVYLLFNSRHGQFTRMASHGSIMFRLSCDIVSVTVWRGHEIQ
jgi:hypothetical protein